MTFVQSIRVKWKGNTLSLDQAAYAREILKEFNMEKCKSVWTLFVPNERLPNIDANEAVEESLAARYRTLVGSLLYLAAGTRPDLTHCATYVSQCCTNPSVSHWQAAKHALRYLQGIKNFSITYRKTGEPIRMFSDADWASDASDRKSFREI